MASNRKAFHEIDFGYRGVPQIYVSRTPQQDYDSRGRLIPCVVCFRWGEHYVELPLDVASWVVRQVIDAVKRAA